MKKILTCFILTLVLAVAMATIAFAGVRVMLDGEVLEFDVPPQIIDGRTMVPLRAIFEALGADIDWDAATQTVTATMDDVVAIMQVGNPAIKVAGDTVTLDVPPMIVDGRTLVPARAVAESFAIDVYWDGDTRTVVLATTSDEPWVIGIMTGTISQGEEYVTAGLMKQRFGYDRILTTTYPDFFGTEPELTIANIRALVDQGVHAIVIVQAPLGVTAAIQQVRADLDEEIFFFVGVPHESPSDIATHADVVVDMNHFLLGQAVAEQAVAMGAERFVHISFPRHLAMSNISYRRDRMIEVAEQHGLEWVDINAPDPMIVGFPASQMFIQENLPYWVAEYGQNTAFFTTNCAMQIPLISEIAVHGGLFVLLCCPGPFHGFPQAFGIDMTGRNGDVDFVLSQIAASIEAEGAIGRISTWPVPINTLLMETGVMYAIEFLEGRTNGRNDYEILRRVIAQVAAETYGLDANVFEVRRWSEFDGNLQNFYLVLSDFVTF